MSCCFLGGSEPRVSPRGGFWGWDSCIPPTRCFPFVTLSLCARPHVLSSVVGEGECAGGATLTSHCVPPQGGHWAGVRGRAGCQGSREEEEGEGVGALISHRARCRLVVPGWGAAGRAPSPPFVPPQPCGRSLNSILGKSNLKFAGMAITLTISTSSLNLMATDCKQVSPEP